MSVTKAVWEGLRTAFYFSKDAFDGVSIPVFFVLESERVIATGSMKRKVTVNEKQALVKVVFLDQFQHEIFRCIVISCRLKLGVENVVSVWIDSLNKSKALVCQPEVCDFW